MENDILSPLYQKLWKSIHKPAYTRIFAYIRDESVLPRLSKTEDLKTLQAMDDPELINACISGKYANDLCNIEEFWHQRSLNKYGMEAGNFIHLFDGWRDFYFKNLDEDLRQKYAEGLEELYGYGLSGDDKEDMEILLTMDDSELVEVCGSGRYANEICNEEEFWHQKSINKFGKQVHKDEDFVYSYEGWEDYYLKKSDEALREKLTTKVDQVYDEANRDNRLFKVKPEFITFFNSINLGSADPEVPTSEYHNVPLKRIMRLLFEMGISSYNILFKLMRIYVLLNNRMRYGSVAITSLMKKLGITSETGLISLSKLYRYIRENAALEPAEFDEYYLRQAKREFNYLTSIGKYYTGIYEKEKEKDRRRADAEEEAEKYHGEEDEYWVRGHWRYWRPFGNPPKRWSWITGHWKSKKKK